MVQCLRSSSSVVICIMVRRNLLASKELLSKSLRFADVVSAASTYSLV